MLLTVPHAHVGLGVEVKGESGNCVTDNLTATAGVALGSDGPLVGGVDAAIGAAGKEVAGNTATLRITAVAGIESGAARLEALEVRGLNTLVRSDAGGLTSVGGDATTTV